MVARDAETDFAVDFEAAGRGEETEVGRLQRVGWGEGDLAVVDAVAKGRGGRGPA